jgi:hypothetical protein
MKHFISIVLGVTVIPLTLMTLFSGVNYVLSLLFNVKFAEIQYSPIWIIEGIASILLVVVYFILTEEKQKNG